MPQALFGFAYSEDALGFLRSLPKKIRRQIVGKIEALATEPFPPSHKVVQGMSERVYRIRSGDYRMLYVVREYPRHIVILDIGHRKDIYK